MESRCEPGQMGQTPAELIGTLEAKARKHFVNTGGCRMAWRCFGAGKPLVLVHGGHGSWLHWVRNIDTLAQGFEVWVPDLPGYGDSDVPSAPELSSIVDATAPAINELLGAETIVRMAAFSFGGLVAANVSAVRGGVDRLVLLGAAGHGSARRPRGELLAWRAAQAANDDQAVHSAMRHNLAMHMLHDPTRIDNLAVEVHTSACMRTRFRSKEISRGAVLAAALNLQTADVLAAWGEHDVTADPQRVIGALFEGRDGRAGCVIQGAGHWVQYERADETNRLMMEWLEKGETK
ncbi:alpha/beta fold hydrolase [Noviherbaspirillum denitrificans]|uniref:AB hydrolase-1 domain-containing protein n=1 Tax=Noviherbaspirillum denitrificans TaxID=1968433 RepID=A0A254TEW5_9BURK|nr:alpha/beta hydrolase [Noviherbaspirillum denitrificans]OWW21144.1 hypothetical protein AYR66_18365 [Noviherbaspirillum denitrificans]